jgi:hypothetical protein
MGATTDPRLSPEEQRLAGIQNLSRALRRTGATLSGDPRRMALQAQEDEALRQGRLAEDQKRRLNQFLASPEGEKYRSMGELLGTQVIPFMAQDVFKGKAKREIVEGIDGFKYYADTGERVLPSLEEPKKEYGMKQDVAGYWKYTEGPDKGKRVFPESEKQDPLPDIKDEASLRKEFNDQSENFKGIAQSFGKVAATDPTAAGDVSLIFAYMKMLDPTSVVREGEQATAAEARGVPEGILNLYNRIITGQRLTEPQRADFRKQAQNIYELALEDQSLNVSRYKNIAEQKGFDPEVIVFDYSESIQPIIFEMSLKEKSLQDLQNLNVTNYDDEQLEMIAKALAEKLGE